MTDIKKEILNRWPSWLLWLIWLSVLIAGTTIADKFLTYVSIGPPYAITALLGYAFFFSAFRKTWPRNRALPLSAAILHAWYLIFALGLFDTIEAGLTFTAVLIAGIICATSFIVPIIVAARAHSAAAESRSLETRARLLSRLLLLLVIFGSPVLFIGFAISAAEFVQSNAFREFCKRDLDGMPIDMMKKTVPARFIRTRPVENEFEISSHGRGCIVIDTGARAAVKGLLPKFGFSWMLSAREGARLKGAFE